MFVGKLLSLMRGMEGEWVVSVTTRSDPRELFERLRDDDVRVDIKKYSKHRSLDANAYAWVLIDQIAEETGLKKTEVYRKAIREIGGVSDTVCVIDRAVDRLREGWSKQGLGWQTEVLDSKLDGCKNVVLYYGSSAYDTRQMSQLIDSLIQDAEALGIPTMTEKETERLLGNWSRKGEKSDGTGNDSGRDYPAEGGGVSEKKH